MSKNVQTELKGHILTIKVDLSKNFGESKSGKSIVIASTEGNMALPEDSEVKIGLNVYRPASK